MLGTRRVKLAYIFVALLAFYALLEWGFKAHLAAILLSIPVALIGMILVLRFSYRLIRQSIWRLRNRLYVTYVFIGLVPIVPILGLAAFGTWILTGQVAVYLLTSELERRSALLATEARQIAEATPTERAFVVEQVGKLLSTRIPGLQLAVDGGQRIVYPAQKKVPVSLLGWPTFSGYVNDSGRYYSVAVVSTDKVVAIALAPIDSGVFTNTASGVAAFRIGSKGPFVGAVPPPAAGFENVDFTTAWYSEIPVWGSAKALTRETLSVATRPSAILGAVFSSGIDTQQRATGVFLVLLFLLVAGELASLVIGVQLTRTITKSVHGLYEGTMRIAKGDFAWRIPVNGTDQLADLGTSFNNMTAQIENLVVIAKEKERLQSEVQIASDVQNQLFPRAAPPMRTIALTGVCQAARMVSGDYYDYLCLPDGNLAIAIGDVAGKGISAALLMASIQSIMRTQLAAGLAGAADTGYSTSNMVAQLNRQLYASTAPEKYATFFFGVYDDRSRILTYTNAGHLQPLLIRGGKAQLLEVTGTVVGLFPMVPYENQSIELQPGDLLIAYTDGITEPENAYGEEFGVARLTEAAVRYQNSEPNEIVRKIMEAVTLWSTAAESPDDMTVLIAKGLA